MIGEELYEVRRRVAFRDGTVLPQWITLPEAERALWDKMGEQLPNFGLLRTRVLRGFVPAKHQPARPTPPTMGRPWHKAKKT